MSPALVAAAMAAGDLLLMGLEVPTGWFADRFGNRRSLILGSIIQVAGMVCCWLANGIPGLVLACTLVAVGDAFRSGADEALLYRTCAAIGREGSFQRIEARSRAIQVVALAGLIVGGGAIVSTWGFAAGWAAETMLCTIGGAIAYAMVEPPAAAVETEEDDSPKPRTRIPWRTAALVILPLALLDAVTAAARSSCRRAATVARPRSRCWSRSSLWPMRRAPRLPRVYQPWVCVRRSDLLQQA